MKDFNKSFQNLQVIWRKTYLKNNEWGKQNRGKYAWVLPRNKYMENFYNPIADPLFKYLKENRIKPHTGIHNLKSSWVQCANLYFQISYHATFKKLFASFLNKYVSEAIESVDKFELEFAFDKNDGLHPSKLLGEKDGGRGFGQTSPDFGVVAGLKDGRKGMLCIENKLVEHSFYRCSARTTTQRNDRIPNPDPSRCMDINRVLNDTENVCHQYRWGRKYWHTLKPSVDLKLISELTRCPAATAGYQLFRQQALCEGIARSGRFGLVISCVAYDERNENLIRSMKSTGINDFTSGWGRFFNGLSGFAVFTHQSWVSWVREHEPVRMKPWLQYVHDRYGY